MAFEITIPRLGWSMEEGIFAGWRKNNGDLVRPGEILFELEGEKALQEVEALDEGILRQLPDGPSPGTVLKVGDVIGHLLLSSEALPHSSRGKPVTSLHLAEGTSQSDDESSPELSVDQEALSGTNPNGPVSDEQSASETNQPAGQPAAMMTTIKAATIKAATIESAASEAGSAFSLESGDEPGDGDRDAVKAVEPTITPRARRAAIRLGFDWSQLTGTGKRGRIRERDVLNANAQSSFFSQTNSATDQPTGERRVVLAGRRRIIADRLAASARSTVPVTLTTRADATNLVGLREQFKSTGQTSIPAVHDIILKLVASELSNMPILAACWDGDAVILPDPHEIHVGLAVDTADGLIVPVIRNVTSTPLMSIADTSAKLIRRARSGRLTVPEMQGGMFTISNLGSAGIDFFTPVINLPETAILGLGTIRKEPVVGSDGQVIVRQMMALSLTFDHRVIDGAPAARFLQSVATAIAAPAARLLTTL